MGFKLIVYVDGSFRDNKGGWSYTKHYSNDMNNFDTGSGACNVVNNNQAEIIACIKALENMVVDKSIEYIEIRTDHLTIVEKMNKVSQFYYMKFSEIANLMGKENAALTLRLAQLVIESPHCIKFSKTNKRDEYNRRVHYQAKHALNYIMDNDNYNLRGSITDNEITVQPIEQSHQHERKYNVSELKNNNNPVFIYNSNDEEKLVGLDVSKIILCDEVHLKAQSVDFDGYLYKVKNGRCKKLQVVVRQLEHERYALVLGFRSYCIAKIMGIEKVNALITDLSRQEIFKRKMKVI